MSNRKQRSKAWIQQHLADPYVKKAQQLGYRSRAACKLQALHEQDRLFKPGMTVVDLGSAPGGWSQVVSESIGLNGLIIGVDILPMAPLPNVTFIQGDFTEASTLTRLLELLDNRSVDLVISDLAPNLTGISSVDQAKMMELIECAMDFCDQVLRKGGDCLIKMFHGTEFSPLRNKIKQKYQTVVIRKPEASRAQSKEVYLLAKGFIAKN